MSKLDCTTPSKRCNDCGETFPLTTEFWHRNRANKDGFNSCCKPCARMRTNQAYAKHIEHRREINRRKAKAFRERKPQRAREFQRNSESKKPELYTAIKVRWQRNNPSKVKATNQEYLARKRNLPADFTAADWERCLTWWGHKCAYCGATGKLSADHFIPLASSDCPGTVVQNMLPACKRCNSSKMHSDPIAWLSKRLPDYALHEVLAQIAVYLDE